MKKMLLLLLSTVIMLSSSTSALAKCDIISANDARKDAATFLEISKGLYPDWKDVNNIQISLEQRTLYDFDGNINAYLFPVTDGKTDHGYIIESAIPASPGLLEATTAGESPYVNVASDKGIYVGFSSFYSKVDSNNFEEIRTKQKIERSKHLLEGKKGSFNRETVATGKFRSTSNINNTLVTPMTSSYYILGGIGNIAYNLTAGCVPIAAANVAKYWATKGGYPNFPNLIKNSGVTMTDSQITAQLHDLMDTDDATGGTTLTDTRLGFKAYWEAHGYYGGTIDGYTNNQFSIQQTQLNNNRPTMLLVKGDTTPGSNYGDHAVTGIGYQETTSGTQYFIVYDGYSSGAVVYPVINNAYDSSLFIIEPFPY
jgi:hypothetical protein